MRKKNFFLRTGMAILAITAAFLQPLQVKATSTSEGGYTYNYDYWGDYVNSADFYNSCKVFTSSELGLDLKLKNPQGLFAEGNTLYLCDSGNNRIIELNRVSPEQLEVVRIIDKINGGNGPKELNNPTDVAVSEDGNIFIADNGNARVVKVDKDLNYIMEFVKPTDNTLDPKLVFQPFAIGNEIVPHFLSPPASTFHIYIRKLLDDAL